MIEPEEIEYARYVCVKKQGWTCGKIGISPHDYILRFEDKDVRVCNATEKRIAWGIKDGWIKFVEDLDTVKDIAELVDLFIHSELPGVTKKEAEYFDAKAHELRPEVFPSIDRVIEERTRELEELLREREKRGEDDDQPKKRKNKKDRKNPV